MPGVCGGLAGGGDDRGVWRRLAEFVGVEDLAGVVGTRTGIGGDWVAEGESIGWESSSSEVNR